MKKISLIFLMFICIFAFGQKKNVTDAWSYLRDGFLDDAKTAIDKAESNVDTKDWYRTYFYKGKIYREIGISKEKKYKKLCGDECFDIAYDALMKSIKLNFTKQENKDLDLTDFLDLQKFIQVIQKMDSRDFLDTEAIYEIIGILFPVLCDDLANKGIDAYKKLDFENSYKNFEKAMTISFSKAKADDQLIFLTALAALETKRFKEAIECYEALIKLDYGQNNEEKIRIYINQALAYKELNDTVKMLKTLDKGIEKFPKDNYPLIIEAFNFYVKNKNNQKALDYINLAIEKNSNNPQFYSIKGTLLQDMKKLDAAVVEYENAIKLDPNNFDAYYQLGAMYFNAAADTIAWANNNIPPQEFKKMDAYNEIAKEFMTKSLPYLEKAYEIKTNNLNVLQTLRTIYYKVGNLEKYQKIDAELKEITSKNNE